MSLVVISFGGRLPPTRRYPGENQCAPGAFPFLTAGQKKPHSSSCARRSFSSSSLVPRSPLLLLRVQIHPAATSSQKGSRRRLSQICGVSSRHITTRLRVCVCLCACVRVCGIYSSCKVKFRFPFHAVETISTRSHVRQFTSQWWLCATI